MTRQANQTPVLAFDVGGTTIKAEVIAGDQTLKAVRRPTPTGAAAVDAIADVGAELMAAVPGVSAAGVALPGIVDRRHGIGVFSANVGWRDLPIAEPLELRWGLSVRVEHDVAVAGWAEWRDGAGSGVDDLAYVSLGTGISAALVCSGRLVRGGHGQAGELGHIVVRPGGPSCGCGARGCLEAVASAAAIRREYEMRAGRSVGGAAQVFGLAADAAASPTAGAGPAAAGGSTTTDPAATTGPATTDPAATTGPAAAGGSATTGPAAGDPAAAVIAEAVIAEAVIAEAVAALADGLAGLVQLVAPHRIVMGGGLTEAGSALLDPLRTALAERCRVVPAPDLVPARFGPRAGVVGAALLARVGDEELPR